MSYGHNAQPVLNKKKVYIKNVFKVVLIVISGASPQTVVADYPDTAEDKQGAMNQRVMVIKTPPTIITQQGLKNFVGISGNTVGAKGLTMNLVIIPPGGRAKAHSHQGFESAVYMLEGRVETRFGPGLKQSVITEAGDFIFIPPNVPHQPINLSASKPARAIVVRNDPNEQESVILYEVE